ncbi:HepT-like ribonuclease domain-containing protein [Pontibacter pudoricolor]|uniref:HepT-like ribonuclease domain-containing protein n=1 Tax=Pontibacter pudoricolor TaxID=2694930 RepID=UPI001EE4E7B4|nr:HepT-like ribonuclease domain-containing protein [Pontibacter pudoricolor]
MDERIEKWLLDIKIAIDEIDQFFEEQPKSFQAFKSNLLLRRAVERNLEIIGEAMNRILIRDPDFPVDNARRIVGLRNQIIHAYDNLSDELIWSI